MYSIDRHPQSQRQALVGRLGEESNAVFPTEIKWTFNLQHTALLNTTTEITTQDNNNAMMMLLL